MPGTNFLSLIDAKPTSTVLDNLQGSAVAVKSSLSDALNSALKSQLSDVLTKASLPAISGLVEHMPSADIVAVSSLSIQAFLKQQLDPMVAKDPMMQQAVDGELAKLSDTTTVGALLQLDTPLRDHPLFKADMMKADLASLLATSPTLGQNQQLQADFIQRYAGSTGSIQDFWNQLSNDPEFKAVVPELQFTLQLGTVTLNNTPLLAAIRNQYRPKSVRDLTALSASDWTQLITSDSIPIPTSISGANPAEKTTNYVNTILGALRSAFPTDYVAQTLGASPRDLLDEQIASFLKKAPQFNLITTNLQQFLAHNPPALAGIEDQSTYVKRFSGYQRLTRLNSDPQIVTALASKGLDSAYKISSLPRAGFLSQYSQLLGGSDKAQTVYDSAQRITAATLNFYTTVHEGLSGIHPWVFGDVSTEVAVAVQQIPNWQTLFGPTSYCTCRDCRSILSAAAYLTDLLHLLSKRHTDPTNQNSATLLDMLNKRRPDLTDIKLNCENTNTTLPYLDLINEILETVVTTAGGKLTAYNTPADATSDELSVNPEYTSDAAYIPLASAFYPFSLPFDRFLTIARSYLQFAGSSLYDVMRAFQIGADPAVPANSNPNPAPSDQAIALEYLNISSNESLILTGQPFQGTSPLTNPNDLAKYYGEQPILGPPVTISVAGAVRADNVVTITTTVPHNFSVDDTVYVFDVGDSSFDGTFTIATVPSPTTFTYSQMGPDTLSGGGSVGILGSPVAINPPAFVRSANIVTVTTETPHNLSVNDTVNVHGVSDSSFDGTFTVTTVPSATTFTYSQMGRDASSGGGAAGILGSIVAISPSPQGAVRTVSGTYIIVVTITTATPHNLSANDIVVISGVSDSSFDGTFIVASVPSATTFTYGQTGGANASSGGGSARLFTSIGSIITPGAVRKRVISGSRVTITTAVPHNLSANSMVIVSGVSDPSFNGRFLIQFASTNSFTYTQSALDADAYSGGGAARSLGNLQTISVPGAVRSKDVVRITTTTPHNFSPLEMVAISEVSDGSFDGTFAITQVLSPTQFTYNQTGPDSVAGGGVATTVGKLALVTGLGAVRKNNGVTITTVAPHNFSPNDAVLISGMEDTSFDGIFIVRQVPAPQTFTYDQIGPDAWTSAGIAFQDWYTDIASASKFVQQTGISFQDLVDLLETHFLNPSQSITLQPDPVDPCNVDGTVIANLSPVDAAGNVDFTALKKFYRFIRLYQKLAWTISDLDAALRVTGATDINASFLLNLSQVKQLQDRLGLRVPEILALWENLDTEGSDSLYLSLFQNKGTVSPLDPTFPLRYTYALPTAPASGLSFLDAYAAKISPGAKQLQFTGALGTDGKPQPMTVNQERFLLSLSTDTNYREAVKQLFLQNPAPLASLPPGFTLPTQLPDAIYHDSQGKQFFIIGQMSDAFRTQLKGLSTDGNYQLAIDNLYAMRWAPGTQVAVATQALASQAGQLIPAQTIPAHANTLLAGLRISAVDLAAIVSYLWSQSAPAAPVVTARSTGGSLESGTYYVKVSTVDAFGEWLYSDETSVVVTGPKGSISGSISVSWASVPGAISYNVYYSTRDGGPGSESLKISSPPATTSATITTTAIGGLVSSGTAPANLAFPLNVTNLSAVYRFARLARALNISAADLLSLVQLIGINPFQPSVPGTPATPGTIEFVAKAQEVLKSKFSVSQLNYIYRNLANPSTGLGLQQSDLDQFVSALQTAMTAPATEKSPTTDPTGQLLQWYLQAVLEQADVSELMQIIKGTAQFSARLQELPPVSFPPSLQRSISFSGGTLTFTGPMSVAQENQLLALSTDSTTYRNAIQTLFQQSQPAWAKLYNSAPSPAPLSAVTFPGAFKGVGSNAVPFSISSVPVISSVTPPAGQASDMVTIAGANFGSSQGTSTVTLKGVAVTTVNSWNETQIQFRVPTGATSGDIVVTVGGNASKAVPFLVGTMPVISSVSPPASQVSAPVTIAGVNFGSSQGASTVTVNGIPVTQVNSWNDTQIMIVVPAGATSGNIVVTVGGTASNAVPFSVGTMPVISSVSPPVVQAPPSVTIAGANFGSSQGSSTVTLNGSPLTVNSWSDTQIVVTLLAGASSGNIVVNVAGNASNAVLLSIGTAPMISSVSPPAAPVSASVTIIGVNFGTQPGTSTVTVNGAPATQVNSWSETQISIVVPTGATTNGNIVVTVGGTASNAVPFTVGTTPVISSVTPPAGQALPMVVTAAGANFGSSQGKSTVTLNGAPVTVNRWINTQITITVPTGANTGSIVVTVGGTTSNAVQFSVASTAVISSVSPPEVQVPPPVTIAGVNFGAQQGTSAVTLNGVPATVTNWSDTQIRIIMPPGATSGNIVVSVGGLIAIDPTNSFIMFMGPMSLDQENQLLALSSDPNYHAAIQDLYQQSKSVWTNPYTFGLPKLPSITLPNLNSGVITFDSKTDPTNPLLKFTGSLSDADEATLLSLSTDAQYQQAVESLYVQPRQFLLTKLFFLDTVSLIAKLINDPTTSIADKYGFVLNSLLSSIGLIVQAVSSTLHLDAPLVRLLIVGGQSASSPALLKAFVDPNLAAIADFFALLGNGLSSAYFSSPNFGGSTQTSNDPAIDFNWGPTSPPLPGLDPNAFSAKWTGQLLPGFSETYTFYVRVVPPGGTVTTKGTTVNWISGATFNAAWPGATIYINDVAYGIQSVATDGLTLTLASSAGSQSSPVPYYVPPAAGTVTVPVAGTTVNWASGPTFNPAWVGATIYISGVEYTVRTVAANGTSLTLNVPAPTQTAVPYTLFNLSINGNGLSLTQLQASGSNPPPPNAGPPPIEFTASAPLSAGVLTSIELDYPNATGSMLSGLHLSWSSLSTPKSVIPEHQLYADSTFSFDKPLGTFKLLSRIALLVNTFRITLGDLTYLSAKPAAFEGVDPNNPNDPSKAAPFNLGALPSGPSSYIPALFNQWERLLALFTLRDALPTGDSGLLALFEAAGNTPAPTGSTLISAIATATSWDPSELGVLLGSQTDALISASIGFGLTAGDFLDERWLVRLRSCFALMTRFGVSSRQLFEWAALGANPSGAVTTSGTTVTWASGANFSTAWTLATIYINGVPYGIQSVATNALTLLGNAGTQTTAVPFYVTGFTQPFEPNVARNIQAAIKAKYDDSTWVKVGKKLNDKLRQSSRDVLVAYILANSGAWLGTKIATADELYEYYLIDVEMGACMQTSRIVQATLAIQLFVQRCLINLEEGISPAAIDTTVWEWMKNYRVWQANREVFLYPEDWIDPTLRDDKTSFFKDLENELRQNPLTPQTVEQAIRNYLDKLEQVARLEVCGICYQFDPGAPTLLDGTINVSNDVLHVVARTASTPHVYFYRRLVHASQYGADKSPSYWTPWENVRVDIQGDHLIPVVWNGHLYLFWPIFSAISDSTTPPGLSGLSLKKSEIHLAWSQYNQGKWSPKQTSLDSIIPSYGLYGYDSVIGFRTDPAVPRISSVLRVQGSAFSGAWVGASINFTDSPSGLNSQTATVKSVENSERLTVDIDLGQIIIIQAPPVTMVNPLPYNCSIVPFQLSPYYSGTLDTRRFTFSYALGATASDDLVINAFIAARWNLSGLPDVYCPDAPVGSLADWGDPQSAVAEMGSFRLTSCGATAIATNASPVSSHDIRYRIPPNTIFENMVLREIYVSSGPLDMGKLTVPFLTAPGVVVDTLILSKTPSPYRLVFGESQFVFDRSVWIPQFVIDTFFPFFYQDDDRTYFVTPQNPSTQTITNASDVVPGYNRQILAAPSRVPLLINTPLRESPTMAGTAVILRTADGQNTGPLSPRTSGSPIARVLTPTQNAATNMQLQFGTFWHPHVCAFIKKLNQYELAGLLSLETQQPENDVTVPGPLFQKYSPVAVAPPFPKEGVDFSYDGAYSIYNWELFFHIPLLVATLLSQDQQFAEAEKWFHYIFNPITNSSDPVPQRFWKFRPFYDCSVSDEISGPIEILLRQLDPPSGTVTTNGKAVIWISGAVFDNAWQGSTINIAGANYTIQTVGGPTTLTLAGPGAGTQIAVPYYVPITLPPEASECGQQVDSQVSAWKEDPFNPFLIARLRTIAFRKMVVMKYLDNLIAWGDHLFSQNTRESINEATQIYILAQQILGDKPVTVPPQGTIQDYSYNELVQQGLDDLSNRLVALESAFPFSIGAPIPVVGGPGTGAVNGAVAQSFYFCIPPNDQLLGYWDTVADRLFKIRNCMNIQGTVEQLPLFAPPISPALLVQARAMGIDLGSVLNEINAPTPNYRFTFMLQKALELCAEVRSLGAALLAALEKNDAEGLSTLRATHELGLLQAVLQLKRSQVDEATNNLAALRASQSVAQYRQTYYQGLISAGLTAFERGQMAALTEAEGFKAEAQLVQLLAPAADPIPDIITGAAGLASPVVVVISGGRNIAAGAEHAAQALTILSDVFSFVATMVSLMGQWDRRSQEWNFQSQMAGKEVTQIQSQIDAAQVRAQIATADLQNQQLQITNAQAVLDFLNSKYTNQELYRWMVSQISATYFQCYQLAYGLAKRADACFRFELGLTASNFIQFGYWDSLRKGLQAGEGLYADLKRMEIAYLDQNRRKYEITKYISLLMFDPLALITLKETGQCLLLLPEALFDMDYPGHYLRQIESVSLTMPCVTGPYTSVNCKLTLVSSKIRVDTAATSPQDYVQDSHFITNFAATQSIVTSSAQNDSGVFELNFRDERYLPFQGAGVISQWLIELPQDCNAFDFDTISDLVINLKYSARDGGDALQAVAKQAATLSGPTDQGTVSSDSVSFPAQNNLVRFFSLRHEFPTEWYKFLNPLATDAAQTMLLPLTKERFPFQYLGKKITISQVDLLLKFKDIHNTQQFTTGTPLGDFAAGAGAPGLLNVYVTQATQAPTQPPANMNLIPLTSNPVNFNGAPYGSSPIQLSLGLCWLQVFTSANYIGSVAPTLVDSNNHLLPGIIEDVFLVCHYRTT